MSDLQPNEKFIAYVDILGFKSLVRASEEGQGLPLSELYEAPSLLGTEVDRKHFQEYGPTTCPEAPRLQKDMDFIITQASDCVIVSAEISPAGVINLIAHCWKANIKLLWKGLMCRGYIKQGKIYHTKDRQIGSGLNEAVERERQVEFFKTDADERGTPFIESDPEVVAYVKNQPDECVKKMFSRMVKTEGELTAVFPIQRLNHSFVIGGMGRSLDREKERYSLNAVRGWIDQMKKEVLRHVDPSDSNAVRRGNLCIRMLDAQRMECDKTEEMLDFLFTPFP